uniref:Uncharacterized protein n=1 Tax=Tetradesmus obliquus TaxID=3088 RepID=A0A383WE54_TETOB|eukprot:jgi/Sobl393_1/1105/SZX72059.1
MANLLSMAGACCTQAASSSTRSHWVAIPTPARHTHVCMQQRSVLPVTPAAFRSLPGSINTSGSFYLSSDDLVRLPSPSCPASSSAKTHCPAWQLSCSLPLPAAAPGGSLTCLCADWPLLLPDNSTSSGTTCSSTSAPHSAAAADTVANVLLLLGNVNESSVVVIRESSSSNVRSGDSSSFTAAATAPASALHGAGVGCPPNAPARRRPPVMLLPAEELPGLLLAA